MELLHKAEATPDEVRGQMERILANRRFAASERSATFLRYVVDRTLAGDGAYKRYFAQDSVLRCG